jgi:hypothetical protein
LSEEHSEHVWVTLEELLAFDLADEVRQAATVLTQHLLA